MFKIGKSDSDEQFDIGDEVFIDFGPSGRLGPGKIDGKLEFSDGWIGYIVMLTINNEGEQSMMGWYGSEILERARQGSKWLQSPPVNGRPKGV